MAESTFLKASVPKKWLHLASLDTTCHHPLFQCCLKSQVNSPETHGKYVAHGVDKGLSSTSFYSAFFIIMPAEHSCKSFTYLMEDMEHLALRAKSKTQLFLSGLHELLPDQTLEMAVSEESHVHERMKAYQRSVMEDKTIPL